MNLELAKGEQALVCLWQIERSTSNVEWKKVVKTYSARTTIKNLN